jgi:hypothetical protein
MLNQLIINFYTRDLNILKKELNTYNDEAKIWLIADGINNSGGNLALHLIGNLNHFIGATLGNTGYVRDRDKEFSLKNVPRREMIQSIQDLTEVIDQVLSKITDEEMGKPFPLQVGREDNSIRFVLLNMLGHLDYHLGQVNYHRRLVGK